MTQGPSTDDRRSVDATRRLERRAVVARGGSGTIYATHDALLLRTIATKVFEPGEDGDRNGDEALRFLEEAQITAQLDHPNVVPVHDLGVDASGSRFFTMKLIEGRTLHSMARERADEDAWQRLDRLLDVFMKICDAVSFAHSRGVVHCDLKPTNVMVGEFGEVYVMDWGIAKLLDEPRPSGEASRVRLPEDRRAARAPGDVFGTLAYLAPEQALGMNAAIDRRTDVFGLGAILYEILARRPPYVGGTEQQRLNAAGRAAVAPPTEVAPDEPIPQSLARIAMRALAADPRRRYQSVAELQVDVDRFRRGELGFPTRTFEPGSVILREGEAADAAYVLVAGECEAVRTEAGATVSLRTIGRGDVFGETAIFTGASRSATVRAVTPVTVMVVTRTALADEVGLGGRMGAFVKALATRFLDLENRHLTIVDELERATLANRVLAFLCRDGERRDDVIVGCLTRCLRALAGELGRSEAELATRLAALADSAGAPLFTIDATRDVVAMPRCNPGV